MSDCCSLLYASCRRSFNRLLIAGFVALFAGPVMAASDSIKIIAIGDSLMAGYGLNAGEALPEQLAKALSQDGFNVDMINGAVSGDTTADGLARFDWTIGDGADLVILGLGANDALRGIDPAVTRANMAKMLDALAEKKIPVVLVGMIAPPNLGQDYAAAYNSIWPDLAKDRQVPLIPFILDGVAGITARQLDDGMHPNAAGIAEMVKRFKPVVIESLKGLPPK